MIVYTSRPTNRAVPPGRKEMLREYHEALVKLIGNLAEHSSFRDLDRDGLYATALDALVQGMLCSDLDTTELAVREAVLTLRQMGLESLVPENAALFYEYARGFALRMEGPKPTLVPSSSGKRNQGLFYTPRAIVRHIVSSSLDALRVVDPLDYLDVKLLDPAVGTGSFLLEAMEQLTDRCLSACRASSAIIDKRIVDLRENLKKKANELYAKIDPDPETAVRIHVMSECLYGVDLDHVAVRIARTALIRAAFKEIREISGFEPRLRVGNALIGNVSENQDITICKQTAPECCGAEKNGPDTRKVFNRRWSRGNHHSWHDAKAFHWAIEFPEVFKSDSAGFDCIVGNPPYEIVSVKESGISHRLQDQAYFRSVYRTCQGKINTYRLMTERGFSLLRDQGVLGFIIPATFLADSTAERLRRMILDESEVIETLIIPEKAQVFEGVTQALLILVSCKGRRTTEMKPAFWDGVGQIQPRDDVSITRNIIDRTDFRIPRIRTPREKQLLEKLMNHPRLGGDSNVLAAGKVHQGEMNLTVDRAFITSSLTDYPLIRGEHVLPLRVCHPSQRSGRLDWVLPEFVGSPKPGTQPDGDYMDKSESKDSPIAFQPWELDRIVLGRVVNMDTKRRLKAAAVVPGQFLGDMTNYIAHITVPQNYLLGLLNSRLLDWRFKLTSANNYLSASELEALPVPRPSSDPLDRDILIRARNGLLALYENREQSVSDLINAMKPIVGTVKTKHVCKIWAHFVEWVVADIRADQHAGSWGRHPTGGLWNALDAAVMLLYGCESYADVIAEEP